MLLTAEVSGSSSLALVSRWHYYYHSLSGSFTAGELFLYHTGFLFLRLQLAYRTLHYLTSACAS